jgi:hypothetical protein
MTMEMASLYLVLIISSSSLILGISNSIRLDFQKLRINELEDKHKGNKSWLMKEDMKIYCFFKKE